MATFRLELPTNTMSRLRQSTPSVHQRLAYGAGAAASSWIGAEVVALAIGALSQWYRPGWQYLPSDTL